MSFAWLTIKMTNYVLIHFGAKHSHMNLSQGDNSLILNGSSKQQIRRGTKKLKS